MKAYLEIGFSSPGQAKAALKAFEAGGGSEGDAGGAGMASVRAGVEKNALRVDVAAAEFAALRARTTSALRDLKVIIDAMKMKGGNSV
ncbi:MAG: hypothetical protein NTY90_04875 [Candidatus Micrarchaeota archaeon]|nr:hypothetical protein [Candidatus Micrarchaeota archaeon]